MRTLLLAAGILGLAGANFAAMAAPLPDDPFQPLIQDIDHNVAPQTTPAPKVDIIDKGKVVKTITGGSEVVSYVKFFTYPDGVDEKRTVRIRHVTFKSVPVYTGNAYHDDTVVYAQIAMPADAKPGDKLPGILFLHGGGGFAQDLSLYSRVKEWAAAGYVVVACDLPGIADPKYADGSSGTWRTVPYSDIPRFVVVPDVKASWIYTAEATALKAFALLKTQDTVDPSKLGIVGISWGGYSTTLLCGLLGDRVAAGFSNFGCGFYDEDSAWKIYFQPNPPTNIFRNTQETVERWKQGDASTWLAYFDAGRRAGGIKAHFYLASPANDHFFRPPAVMRTLKAITSASSLDFQFSPNLQPDPQDTNPAHDIAYYCVKSSHTIVTPGGTQVLPGSPPQPNRGWCSMEAIFFDYLLKGVGAPLSHIKLAGLPQADSQKNLHIQFTVTADPPVTLQAPKLYYSVHTPTDTWQKRDWITLDAPITEGAIVGTLHSYSVTMPAAITNQGVDWYVLISDKRGAWATTTSTLIETIGSD